MTATAAGLTSRERLISADHARLAELADVPVFTLFQRVASSPRGLTEPEAADRLRRFGDNEPFRPVDDRFGARVVLAIRSPFVALPAGGRRPVSSGWRGRDRVTVAGDPAGGGLENGPATDRVSALADYGYRGLRTGRPSGEEALSASPGLAIAETTRDRDAHC